MGRVGGPETENPIRRGHPTGDIEKGEKPLILEQRRKKGLTIRSLIHPHSRLTRSSLSPRYKSEQGDTGYRTSVGSIEKGSRKERRDVYFRRCTFRFW